MNDVAIRVVTISASADASVPSRLLSIFVTPQRIEPPLLLKLSCNCAVSKRIAGDDVQCEHCHQRAPAPRTLLKTPSARRLRSVSATRAESKRSPGWIITSFRMNCSLVVTCRNSRTRACRPLSVES